MLDGAPTNLTQKLTAAIEGEVLSSPADLGRYATDASIYQQTPLAVVRPKSIADVEATLLSFKMSRIVNSSS